MSRLAACGLFVFFGFAIRRHGRSLIGQTKVGEVLSDSFVDRRTWSCSIAWSGVNAKRVAMVILSRFHVAVVQSMRGMFTHILRM